jgi:GntR family transcriptional regulator
MATENVEQPIQFSLDTKSGVPFFKQIIHQVELSIASGTLSVGTKLPTVRSLAVELKINPNTVARAYGEMEIRGLVETQQGSGTYIKGEVKEIDILKRERILSEITRSYISHASSYGFTLEDIHHHIHELIEDLPLKKKEDNHESFSKKVRKN